MGTSYYHLSTILTPDGCHSAYYEAWNQAQSSVSLTSASGTHGFLASNSSSVTDSRASAHITNTPSILSSLSPTFTYPLVSIANGLLPLPDIISFIFLVFLLQQVTISILTQGDGRGLLPYHLTYIQFHSFSTSLRLQKRKQVKNQEYN